jgi:branched-chain amino acid transport system substrate-binding protein
MNKWKVLTAVFLVLTIVLGGGLAYVATLSRPASGTVTYPIGIEIAISGSYATDGPLRRDGAFLAVDQMNDQLIAAASPIRFQRIHEDSGGTPTGATNSFNALVAAGVKVIVGPLSSGEVGAIMPLANANKIVSISPSSTAPRLAADDYSFRVAPNDAFQAKALCRLFAVTGMTKIGVIARDDDYGRGIANLTETIFKAAPFNGQVTKVMYDPAALTHANEVTALSTAIAAYGTGGQTAVLIVAFETDGLDILDRARQDPTLSSVRWFGSETLKRTAFLPPTAPTAIGDFLVARNMTGFFASAAKNPVVTAFELAYNTKYGRAPSPYAYYAYDAAWIGMLAVLRAGKYDGQAIRAMIPLVGMQYIGASGHKVFDANGDFAAADYRVWHVTHLGITYAFTEVATWFYATDTIRWD